MGLATLRAIANVAQSAGASTGVWVALAVAVITGGGGLLAGIAAFLNNRRQARADAASGVRQDVQVVLDAYREGIAGLRADLAARDQEIARKDQEIAALREEVIRCHRRAPRKPR